MKKPIILTILDGFGIAEKSDCNAISCAKTPVLDDIFRKFPHSSLQCSGLAVGLPRGQMGNSEVGHLNMGAGRVVFQELTRISRDIETGDFFENPTLKSAASGRVHLMGLLSDGGVHSHLSHLFALIDLCNKQGAEAYVHCFLDGRDAAPQSGVDFLRKTQEKCSGTRAKIATVCGRYFAMDRDNRWERVEKAYNTIALGQGKYSPDCAAALAQSYENGVTDEFAEPYICCDNGDIRPQDSVIFFNFRPDRARE
ncbi:MAG: 2,3-bisphosphoglycerate-independent phosphoglycerate mutase, partial [Oscillospiraceae bacterium]